MPITHEGATYYSQAELDEQLTPLRTEAEQARGSLSRYQAAAAAGITDGDTIWALEQAHQRQMSSVQDPAARVDFSTWLGQVKATPDLAPSYLRGVLAPPAAAAPVAPVPPQGQQGQQAAPVAPVGQQGAPMAPVAPQAAPVPPVVQQGGRPAWAPAVTGQREVAPGARPDFAARVQAATSIQELSAIAAERRGR